MGKRRLYLTHPGKPSGFWGILMLRGMNVRHGAVSDWGLEKLHPLNPSEILELGCGGGRNAAALMKRFPGAALTALDHSETAVRKTLRFNRAAAASGRCRVLQGDVSALPFADCGFDLATAFETVYFWPGPEKSFLEVFRVLRPGGFFLIVNEADGTGENDAALEARLGGLKIFTAEQLTAGLAEAGFDQAAAFRDPALHRLCLLARKPPAAG